MSCPTTVVQSIMLPQGHRKKIKHYHRPGDLHELTFSCYRRMPLLTNDAWRTLLASEISSACREKSFELVAFVFMPEHVHLLVNPLEVEPDMGRFLALCKQPYSKQVKQQLTQANAPLLEKLTVRERPGKHCFRYWQEGPGYDRNLFKADSISASINYIHTNPVKRGLCQRAIDWKWSSACYYQLEPPKQQFPSLPHIHGLPPGAFDASSNR